MTTPDPTVQALIDGYAELSSDELNRVVDILLTEYKEEKAEQRTRITARDQILYWALVSMAAIVVSIAQVRDFWPLLLLPVPGTLLGWRYLVTDHKITDIGDFIRADLGPRLDATTSHPAGALRWETAHRDDRRRGSRARVHLALDVLGFSGAPVAGLVTFWVLETPAPALAWTAVLGLLLALLVAVQLIVYSPVSLRPRRRWHRL